MTREKRPITLPPHIYKYLTDFKEYLKYDRRLAAPTIYGYVYCTERFLEFVNCDPCLVATKDVRDFIKYSDERGLKSSAVAGYICSLRSFYNWMFYAYKTEQMGDVSFYLNKIVRSKVSNEPTQVPSENEVQRVHECMNAYRKAYSYNPIGTDYKVLIRDFAVIEVFKATGCRSGELKHVTMADLNLEDMTMAIRKGKGGKQRVAIFGDSAKDALLAYIKEFSLEPQEKLFCFTRFNIFWNIIKRWALRAGINPRIHPHSWRHYHITKAQRDGVTSIAVANQVGHENLNTTMRYTHLDHHYRREKYKISDLQK